MHRRSLVRCVIALVGLLSLVAVAPPALAAQGTPQSGGGKVIPLCQTGCLTYGVSVSPKGGFDNQPESATGLSYGFIVANTGSTNESDTYTVSCTTSGPVVCDSLVSAGGPLGPLKAQSISPQCFHCGGGSTTISLTLTGGTQSGVTAWAHTQSTTGSGVLTVTATGTHADADHGWDTITVTAPAAPTVALLNGNQTQIARDLCFTSGAGEAAGVSCGDLFVVHGMPAYRTMGKDRSLGLEYNSATAKGTLLVPLKVSESSTALTPTAVKVVLKATCDCGGTVWDSATFNPVGSGTSQQMVLGHGLGTLPTGVYAESLSVTNVYASSNLSTGIIGQALVVSRSTSPYGRGWALDGVEQLMVPLTGTGRVWVDGDGSARLYGKLNNTTWVAPAATFRDTLVYDSASQTYTRYLRHGIKVVFNAAGQQIQTINRQGRTTTFTWTTVAGQSRLTAITVPINVAGMGRVYQLTYNNTTGSLSSIKDPGGRQLTPTYTGDQLTSLTDPDGRVTGFAYDPTTLLMTKRSVPRPMVSGGVAGTIYTYANGVRVTGVKIPAGPVGADTSRITITAWDEQGLATGPSGQYGVAVPSGGVPSTVDGPVAGTGDLLQVWVNAFGQPTKTVLSGTHATTLIVYGDTAHPALATSVRGARGDSAVLTYDVRGNLMSMQDLSRDSLNGAPNQKTLWAYEDAFSPDEPTVVQQITHDTAGPKTRYSYTTLGFDSTVTAPNGHQTWFAYTPLGLLQSVTEKAVTTWRQSVGDTVVQDLVSAFTYDSLGNLRTSQDPAGGITTIYADTLGRVAKTWDVYNTMTRMVYDLRNRMTSQIRYTSVKSNPYVPNPAINCDSLSFICADLTVAWRTPDSASQVMPDSVVTAFTYDSVGLEQVADPRGVLHSYHYDAQATPIRDFGEPTLGLPDSVSQYIGGSGLVDSTRQASGLVIRYHYDGMGRRTALVYPQRIWGMRPLEKLYQYCLIFPIGQGSCTSMASTDSAPADTVRGDSLAFVYDSVGQLVQSHGAAPSRTITRSYYANGALKSRISDATVYDTTQIWYDALGRRATAWHATHSSYWTADTTTYVYNDITGNLDSMVVRYVGTPYDTGRRRIAFAWDQLGRRRQVTYPSGAIWQQAYDALGGIRHLEGAPGDCGSWNAFCFQFTNDSVDLRGLVLRTDEQCFGRIGNHTNPTQDCVGQLGVSSSKRYYRFGWLASAIQEPGTDSLIYDASGNIVSKLDYVTGFHFDMNYPPHSNRITSIVDQYGASKNYKWLQGGLRDQEMMAGQPMGGPIGDRAYYYDALDRLSGVYALTDNGLMVQYTVRNNLFRDSVTIGHGYGPADHRNVCTYDPDGAEDGNCLNSAAPIESDGVVTASMYAGSVWHFITGPGVDDPLIGHAGYVNQGGIEELMWATDGHGRQYNITLPDGSVDSSLVNATNGGNWGGWDMAGGMKSIAPNTASRYRNDMLPNFSDFRNRYYDMETGSWSQEDPAGVAGGINLYQYAGNNPVAYSDPFGLKADTLGDVTVPQRSRETGSTANRQLCIDKSQVSNVQATFSDAAASNIPVTVNNAYRDRITPGTGGRPSGGLRSPHPTGFAFDINSSALAPAQLAAFTNIAAQHGFTPLAGDPGHYQNLQAMYVQYGSLPAARAEATRSYSARECTDAQVQAVRGQSP